MCTQIKERMCFIHVIKKKAMLSYNSGRDAVIKTKGTNKGCLPHQCRKVIQWLDQLTECSFYA